MYLTTELQSIERVLIQYQYHQVNLSVTHNTTKKKSPHGEDYYFLQNAHGLFLEFLIFSNVTSIVRSTWCICIKKQDLTETVMPYNVKQITNFQVLFHR